MKNSEMFPTVKFFFGVCTKTCTMGESGWLFIFHEQKENIGNRNNSSPHLLTKIHSVARAKLDLDRFFALQLDLLLWQPRIPYCHPPGRLLIFQVTSLIEAKQCFRHKRIGHLRLPQTPSGPLPGLPRHPPGSPGIYGNILVIGMKPGIYPTDFGLKIWVRWFSTQYSSSTSTSLHYSAL